MLIKILGLFFPENTLEYTNENISFLDFLDASSDTEYFIVSRDGHIWIGTVLPVDFCNGSFIVLVENIFSSGRHFFEFPVFQKLYYRSAVSHSEDILESLFFTERVFKELSVDSIVESVDFSLLRGWHINHLHKEFAMIPEKIKHRKEFLHPDQTFFILSRHYPMNAHLIEIFDKSGRIHNTSAIESILFFNLVIFPI